MKPKVFIASSVEGLPVAQSVQAQLQFKAEVTVWSQGVFELGEFTLHSLRDALQQSDFGVFVFSADDTVFLRARRHAAARDNVVFELGMFIGLLGWKRNFILIPSDVPQLHLPTDLLGMTMAKYESKRSDGNLDAAVGPACSGILRAISKRNQVPRDNTLSDEELRKLLLEFNSDAFITPLQEEGSLTKLMARLTEVRSLLEGQLTRINSTYRRHVLDVFAILKALETEAAKLDIGGLHSRYSTQNPSGIVIDSMRLGIVLRANDMLRGLGYPGRIDGNALGNQGIAVGRLKQQPYFEEWISEMRKAFKKHKLDDAILNSYINFGTSATF